MIKLGVNIDHVATLRQARLIDYPSVSRAAKDCLEAGADSITVHLREDRRHIQDSDVYELIKFVDCMNFEMAATDEMVAIACDVKPNTCCIVPEKREELTTEGGLDLITNYVEIYSKVDTILSNNIPVSLFIDPEIEIIKLANKMNVPIIELHTGEYANAKNTKQDYEFERLKNAISFAHECGITVNIGHGLNYFNVSKFANMHIIHEANIGHSIIAESVFIGLSNAVKKMKELLNK